MIWRMYVAAIPIAQVIQNELRPGNIVIHPTAKAHTSVKDVTVIATPACFIVSPISSSSVFTSYKFDGSIDNFYRDRLITGSNIAK